MRLAAGDAELVLMPEVGGSVASWTIAGRPVFRPANPDAIDARGHACYPLVPFSNRVANRRFSFGGVDHELPALLGGWAIHGAGWQCAWTGADRCMTLDYPGGVLWPFAFHAEQHFDLTPSALSVTLRLTNRHDTPAPAAIGLHPFFFRDDATRLHVAAGSVWQNGADMIPLVNTPVPSVWDFSTERELGDASIDNCFAGWGGDAWLTWPARRERLHIHATTPFRHLVIFVPQDLGFTAIEPVSNMNDGLNRMHDGSDHGVVVLAPGETLEGRITMTVEPVL